MPEYERYHHHDPNVLVSVKSDLKGRHREHCLCYACHNFNPSDRENNCITAQFLYEFCVDRNLVLPVWECPGFIEAHDYRK